MPPIEIIPKTGFYDYVAKYQAGATDEICPADITASEDDVLRKAAESGIVVPGQIPAGIELSEKEEGLIQMVADFAAVVKQAGEDYSPSIIANYTYDLVKEYNQFYHDFSILREENEAVKVFRIALSANVAKVVRLGMSLLGIEVPSRM